MYQQLGILQFIATFIKDYTLYFRIKTLHLVLPGFLKLLELLVCLQTNISINYVINLPKYLYNSKIYRYIFIIINRLIKIKYFISITGLDIKELIKVFIYTIYKLYGALNTIISNRGSLFISNFQRRLNQRLKVTLSPSFIQYPKIDSQTKIINVVINKYLRAFISFT